MSINNQLSKSKIKTEELIESKEQTKNLNIFQHLKTNIHNRNTNCVFENTEKYIPCKISFCKNCFYKVHEEQTT
jgi:hypothetical protein